MLLAAYISSVVLFVVVVVFGVCLTIISSRADARIVEGK
jgi:hypothetical protein